MLRKAVGDVARHARILQSQCASTSGLLSEAVCSPELPFSRVKGITRFLSAVPLENKAKLFNASPVSLASNRVIAEPYDGVEQNILTKTLLKIGGFYSTESKNLRAAKAWYECVTEQVDDSRILPVFGLEDNFADRYSILCIHMWLCLVRLRSEQKAGKQLAQVIYENFQEDVEMRVRAAGVKVRLSKHLMDLEQMFYGTSLSYDKALDGGEDLSVALLRNVYAGKEDKKKYADTLARYIRRELACLSMTDSGSVMAGAVTFSKGFMSI